MIFFKKFIRPRKGKWYLVDTLQTPTNNTELFVPKLLWWTYDTKEQVENDIRRLEKLPGTIRYRYDVISGETAVIFKVRFLNNHPEIKGFRQSRYNYTPDATNGKERKVLRQRERRAKLRDIKEGNGKQPKKVSKKA